MELKYIENLSFVQQWKLIAKQNILNKIRDNWKIYKYLYGKKNSETVKNNKHGDYENYNHIKKNTVQTNGNELFWPKYDTCVSYELKVY